MIYVLSIFLVDEWFFRRRLGVYDGFILDSQIRASSSEFLTTEGTYGRHSGWIAADYDSHPWVQVDFIINVTVSLLQVHGLPDTDHGVTNYTISSGNDGEEFSEYKISKESTAKVRYLLTESVEVFGNAAIR